MGNALVTCFAAFVAGIGFSVIFNVRGPKRIFFHALGGSVGWLAYLAAGQVGGELVQALVGAVAIALYSEAMARRFKMPAAGYLRVAFIPLVPGGKIYYTMLHCLNGEMELFGQQLLETLAVAGCLAVGILLVSTIVQMRKIYQENQQNRQNRQQEETEGNGPV